MIPALFFSLIESKFILPYHLSLCKFDRLPKNWLSKLQNRVSVGLEKFIENTYEDQNGGPDLDGLIDGLGISLN